MTPTTTLTAAALLITALPMLATQQAHAQSKAERRAAACAALTQPSTRAVCRNRHLTRLDGRLNEIYRDLRSQLSAKAFAALRRKQRTWLEKRNRCQTNRRCLAARYRSRVAYLGQMLEKVESRLSISSARSCDGARKLRSRASRFKTTIVFRNRAASQEDSYKIYWLDFAGRRRLYATVYRGDTHRQQTYLTHPWLVTSPLPGGGEICIGVYMPDPETRTVELD